MKHKHSAFAPPPCSNARVPGNGKHEEIRMLTRTIPPALMAEISTLVQVLMALMRPAPAEEFALAVVAGDDPETRL